MCLKYRIPYYLLGKECQFKNVSMKSINHIEIIDTFVLV